ncbi:MAG: MFS transporter [Ilumatobacteraceae bacterium]
MNESPQRPLAGRGRGAHYVPPKHQHRFQASPFARLVRVHASMTARQASAAVALADSLFLSITPGEARGRVIGFLAVSFAPFIILGPLIGPFIDRMPGGRRLLIVSIALLRSLVMIGMMSQLNSLWLFPLAFLAMVLNRTYGVSKSALLPSLIRTEADLAEANAKLGRTAGIVGFLAALPAALLSIASPKASLALGSLLFLLAAILAVRLPKSPVAASEPAEIEVRELHQTGIIIAASAQGLVRASVGFLFFHLAFWFADPRRSVEVGTVPDGTWKQMQYNFGPQFGTFWFGLAVSLAAVGTLLGNSSTRALRRFERIESLLVVGLLLIGAAGAVAAISPVTLVALLCMAVVNYAAAFGNMAFETIVQRDAPDANRGRAIAGFQMRFQLMWVAAGLVPVLIPLPGVVGFAVVAALGFSGALGYWFGLRQVRAGVHELESVRGYLKRRITRR